MSGVRKRERREGSSTQTRRLQVQPREEGRLTLPQAYPKAAAGHKTAT